MIFRELSGPRNADRIPCRLRRAGKTVLRAGGVAAERATFRKPVGCCDGMYRMP